MANEIDKTLPGDMENRTRILLHRMELSCQKIRCLKDEKARLEAEKARLEAENARMDDAIDEYKELISIIKKCQIEKKCKFVAKLV